MGLVESAAEFFPEARWQRCMVHFYRNVFSHVPAGKLREVALMLKAIHAQEDLAAAQRKAAEVVARLHSMRLGKAAELVETAVPETLAYYAFPEEHWRRIRTNNPLERIMREIRRRTRVVGAFPDGNSATQPGRRQAPAHRRHALVDQTVSEHGAAQAAQRDDRLTGAGHRPKCERFWTLPIDRLVNEWCPRHTWALASNCDNYFCIPAVVCRPRFEATKAR